MTLPKNRGIDKDRMRIDKNIPNYFDVDSTTDQFINYFLNDFLPYIPQDTVVDKARLVKLAKEFYLKKRGWYERV